MFCNRLARFVRLSAIVLAGAPNAFANAQVVELRGDGGTLLRGVGVNATIWSNETISAIGMGFDGSRAVLTGSIRKAVSTTDTAMAGSITESLGLPTDAVSGSPSLSVVGLGWSHGFTSRMSDARMPSDGNATDPVSRTSYALHGSAGWVGQSQGIATVSGVAPRGLAGSLSASFAARGHWTGVVLATGGRASNDLLPGRTTSGTLMTGVSFIARSGFDNATFVSSVSAGASTWARSSMYVPSVAKTAPIQQMDIESGPRIMLLADSSGLVQPPANGASGLPTVPADVASYGTSASGHSGAWFNQWSSDHVTANAGYHSTSTGFLRSHFAAAQMPESDGATAFLAIRPTDGLQVSLGRQGFREMLLGNSSDQADPSLYYADPQNMIARSIVWSGAARLQTGDRLFNAGVYRSIITGALHGRTTGTFVSAAAPLTDKLKVDAYLLHSAALGIKSSITPIVTLERYISPVLTVSSTFSFEAGHLGSSVGGSVSAGAVQLSVGYQIVQSPFRTDKPFIHTLSAEAHLPIRNATLDISTVLTPDGRVRYRMGGRTFLFPGGGDVRGTSSIGLTSNALRFPKFILRGRVVTEDGAGVAGIAVAVGRDVVITDDDGRFFVRMSHDDPVDVTLRMTESVSEIEYEPVPNGVPTGNAEWRPRRDGQVDAVVVSPDPQFVVRPKTKKRPQAPPFKI